MKKHPFKLFIIFTLSLASLFFSSIALPESGYRAWLRYQPVQDKILADSYRKQCSLIFVTGDSGILSSSLMELRTGLAGMLGAEPTLTGSAEKSTLVIGTIDKISPSVCRFSKMEIQYLHGDGFIIKNTGTQLIITSKSNAGVLYGVFRLLRMMQSGEPLPDATILENPKIKLRLLNHWDNPGKVPYGTPPIERGYAGSSIFKWEELPELNARYTDYARLLASVGINGTVINNVNTAKNGLEGWKLLTPEYLPKLKALAAIFRKYGIRLYISVNFFSPILVSGLKDADPSNPDVQAWWKNKVAEIYAEIPDFGGFLVKADSEGEPGPIKYGRTQADGANLLAAALKPYGGLLIWRAFVYGKKELSSDRASQAYQVFKPLDGQFAENAVVQIKNGPIDFQVREPVSSLFGAMPATNQILELQITQEYTGQGKHVCYLVPQWKEIMGFDTFAKGKGSSVASIVCGDLFNYKYSGIAGVSNIGDEINWTGHPLAQANLYGFGRIAWDPGLTTGQITREWIVQTYGNSEKVYSVLEDILLTSWKTYEDYTSPLGIGMMCASDHFKPDPSGRVSYHKADRQGVGYDRTMATGSGYTGQYPAPAGSLYEDLLTCPDEMLLFFHHVPYSYKLKSGKTVIQHIYDTHNEGVENVKNYIREWQTLSGMIDRERYEAVLEKLKMQVVYAEEWRDSVNNYFFQLSGIQDNQVKKNIQGWMEQSHSLGIMAGLVIGKPLGIFLFSFIGVIIGVCHLLSAITSTESIRKLGARQ
jgi:alpha-glucuronidase